MYRGNPIARQVLIVGALAGVVLFSALSLFFFYQNSDPPADGRAEIGADPLFKRETLLKQESIRPGLPVRLKIPTINVDAPIEYVGVTLEDEMDVPKDPAHVAWFDRGPRPGEKGSAVIAGHYGWKDDIPAVFDELSALKIGDIIYIEDEIGIIYTFVVRELRVYDQHEAAPEVFVSNDGGIHLNLVTCEGEWNAALESYSNRLVVFADVWIQ